jgi:hypothetical protein
MYSQYSNNMIIKKKKKQKRQCYTCQEKTEVKKIVKVHISNNGLIFRIYKDSYNSIIRRENTCFKCINIFNHFTKDVQWSINT